MPYEVQLFTNNATSTLAGPLPSGQTFLTVATGHGSRFPTPSVDEYFHLTLFELNGSGQEINYEIVKCTAISGDTLTIERDAEGTVVANGGTAGGWSYPAAPGTNPSQIVYTELRYTAHAANNTLDKSGNLTGITDASVARTNLGLGSMALQSNTAVNIDGGTIDGVTINGATITATDSLSTFADNGDPTKQMRFELSGVTTNQTRILTVPDTNGTIATTNAAQTLTLKTIDAAQNTLIGVVQKNSDTGAASLPVGTNAQRPANAAGLIRFNTSVSKFEGNTGTGWTSVGGGATGGGQDEVFLLNGQNVTVDYTIAATKNAGTFGPITVDNGVTVTISNGSVWTVV